MTREASVFGIGLALLTAILIGEYYTDIDLSIQNLMFDFEKQEWLISPTEHKELSFIFYKGIKIIMGLVGLGLLAELLLSIKYKQLRKDTCSVTIMLLSLIFVPLIVAGAKYFTNVYCPRQLEIYNGRFPFVRILESYPKGFEQTVDGRCFPAGHATTGFSFMALFYCFKKTKYRWLGLGIGLFLGWTTAIYQMLRGQHFLSHSLFTMVASFLVITALDIITRRYIYKQKY